MRCSRRALGWAATATAIAVLVGGCSQPKVIEGRGYTQVFADQFNYATQAEMGEVWELHAPFLAAAEPQSITFRSDGNGGKYVRLQTGEFRNWDWTYISTAGPRRADVEPNYPDMKSWEGGYFEARIRYSPNEWTWPTFWMFSASKTENWPVEVCPPSAPLVAEWDILDSGSFDDTPWARDHYHGGLHSNTPYEGDWCGVPDEQRVYSDAGLDGMDLTQWHTWGGYWTQTADGGGEMCVYVDGLEIGCYPTFDSTNQPMVLNLAILNNAQAGCEGCLPPEGTSNIYMDVDWVRVFQVS